MSMEQSSGSAEFGKSGSFIPPLGDGPRSVGGGNGEITAPGNEPESDPGHIEPPADSPPAVPTGPESTADELPHRLGGEGGDDSGALFQWPLHLPGDISQPRHTPAEHARIVRRDVLDRVRDGASAITRELRRELHDRVGHLHNATAIDSARPQDYMAALGLHNESSLLVVSDVHYDEVVAVAAEMGADVAGSRDPGIFLPKLGTAVVNSDLHSSAEHIEETVVHEIGGHGSTLYIDLEEARTVKRYESGQGLAPVPVIGLCDVNAEGTIVKGQFLDEGRAEWIASGYRRAVGDVPENAGQSLGGITYAGREGVYIPAATAFDLLFARDPAMIAPMLRSGIDQDAAEQVVDRLNRIRPGLYDDLAAIQYNNAGGQEALTQNMAAFNRGMQLVMEATRFTDADVQPIVNYGPGARFIASSLARHDQAVGRTHDWYPRGGRPQ
jgi:hypothetical protein